MYLTDMGLAFSLLFKQFPAATLALSSVAVADLLSALSAMPTAHILQGGSREAVDTSLIWDLHGFFLLPTLFYTPLCSTATEL